MKDFGTMSDCDEMRAGLKNHGETNRLDYFLKENRKKILIKSKILGDGKTTTY
jgi:hypothetical protein